MDELADLVRCRAVETMTDDDFIAHVDAISLLSNLYDDLGHDPTELLEGMDSLYPQYSLRIKAKANIQLAMPLIRSLYRFIYGRSISNADPELESHRKSLFEKCDKAVDEYRKCPMMHPADYVYALGIASRFKDDPTGSASVEYRDLLNAYLLDLDRVTTEEKILRVAAYQDSSVHIHWEDSDKWIEARDELKQIDFMPLNDDLFLQWCEVTEQSPLKELKRRAIHSSRVRVEYLRAKIENEWEEERRAAREKKLA